jgi:hypothetical protein
VNGKHILQSKLVWAGVAEVLVGLSDLLQTNVLGSEKAAWGAVGAGVVTIVLRIVTREAVRLSAGKPQ